MDPAENQTHMSVEQHRQPRDESTLIWAINLQQKKQDYTMGEIQAPQWIMLGKPDSCMQKNQTGLLSYTMHKNKFRMI